MPFRRYVVRRLKNGVKSRNTIRFCQSNPTNVYPDVWIGPTFDMIKILNS